MATYRHGLRHSVDKTQEPNIATGYAEYLQDEEKAYLPAVVREHGSETFDDPPETAKDLITGVIYAADDSSLNLVIDLVKSFSCLQFN